MKRRGFLGKVAGGAVAGAAGVTSAQDKAAETGQLMKTPAVIMAPRHDGAEVVWAVSKLSRGRVEWQGEDGSRGTAAGPELMVLLNPTETEVEFRLPASAQEWEVIIDTAHPVGVVSGVQLPTGPVRVGPYQTLALRRVR